MLSVSMQAEATPSLHNVNPSLPSVQNVSYLDQFSIRQNDDYANSTATRYSLVGECLRRRPEQHMDIVAKIMGKVWSVEPPWPNLSLLSY